MFKSVKNPRWAEKEHKRIVLDVQFEGENGFVQFVASHEDCTTHGVLLFNLASQETFGKIEDSDEEKISGGRMLPPAGMKLVCGNLESMTQEEQYEAGQITKEDFETYKSQQNQTELSRRLTELNTPENQAQAIIDDEFAASWKARITALLAVKQQAGWPLTVSWPQ